MKVSMKISPRTTVQVEGQSVKDVFSQIATAQELFAENRCGLCTSIRIRYVVRNVVKGTKTYEYYECRCDDCGARLSFGQSSDGAGLFPKRRLLATGEPSDNGDFGTHNGWSRFRGTGAGEPEQR